MNYELLNMNVVNMFHSTDDNCHDTRQWGNVKQIYVGTTMKAMCISSVGVKLWSSLFVCQRNCHSVSVLKYSSFKSIAIIFRDSITVHI